MSGTPATESNQAVWDRWNAMGPREQATGFVDSDAALVGAYEALTAGQRATLKEKKAGRNSLSRPALLHVGARGFEPPTS